MSWCSTFLPVPSVWSGKEEEGQILLDCNHRGDAEEAPGFGLAQLLPMWPPGEWTSGWKIFFCFFSSLCNCENNLSLTGSLTKWSQCLEKSWSEVRSQIFIGKWNIEKGIETEKNIIHPLVHSQTNHKGKNWANPKPGTWAGSRYPNWVQDSKTLCYP